MPTASLNSSTTATPPAPWSTRSCAGADCVPETDSSQSTRRRREAGSAAPTPPESPASLPPCLRFLPELTFLRGLPPGLGNLSGQQAQLTLVEHRRIDHAAQDLFDRTVAEPVDDALDGFRRNPSAGLRGLVDIGSSIYGVGGVTLVFQSPQHGADGRFLERTRKLFADGLGRDRTIGPHQLHDLALEVAQFRQAVVHGATLRSRASMLQSVAYAAMIRNGYSSWNCHLARQPEAVLHQRTVGADPDDDDG